ncbi:DUF7344 domain-containing protein [Halopiger djelfimassiliensis]|uniref:DUF7344 domain-containing protein n=1 Tax=Halopiger djelfimassiliensis TaxID=1293047 RepID=UPI0006776452|nr:hypothetical protein [Halopiger djelfimassiliensis]
MLPVISDPQSLTTGSADATAETDATLDLLADRYRRAILQYLDERDSQQPVSLEDLADHVTLEEDDRERSPLTECSDALLGTRRRVRISLRHVHLPKLAAAGVVDFDAETNTVTLCDDGRTLLARSDPAPESVA